MAPGMPLPGRQVTVNKEPKWQCQFVLPSGKTCDAILKDHDHNIRCHRKVHDPNSRYTEEHTPFAGGPIRCIETVTVDGQVFHCTGTMGCKQTIVSHYYNHHSTAGGKRALFQKYGL
ncbi:hypothetical protein UCREL1_8451 [Eutypa lata UCREL1]|uniref:Uncharacterized protein n=1 Tax=Eutypa lata (strain UCR-EL1) TaxID=1287681 RepID=M7SJT5_EUTLA|nr:hypothetical protein UCREL1_8451 [Eutypa lata UCREL1]